MPYHPRHLQVTHHHRKTEGIRVPQIRLSGLWLSELGFKEGEQIKVTIREDLMIIERKIDQKLIDHLTYKAVMEQVLQELKEIRKL